jgi:hypothetical protein
MPELTMNGLSISLGCSLSLWPGRSAVKIVPPGWAFHQPLPKEPTSTTEQLALALLSLLSLLALHTTMLYCHKPALLSRALV